MSNFAEQLKIKAEENKTTQKPVTNESNAGPSLEEEFDLFRHRVADEIINRVKQDCLERAAQGKHQLFSRYRLLNEDEVDRFVGTSFEASHRYGYKGIWQAFCKDIGELMKEKLSQEGFKRPTCRPEFPSTTGNDDFFVLFRIILEW